MTARRSQDPRITAEQVAPAGRVVYGAWKMTVLLAPVAEPRYLWAYAGQFGIDPKVFRHAGVHMQVPAGAVPKDGPSAGVAMVSVLASLLTDIPVRSDTAMTGEITLSGLVLPIGGVKEKVLAARRAGMKRVILPIDNVRQNVRVPWYVGFSSKRYHSGAFAAKMG